MYRLLVPSGARFPKGIAQVARHACCTFTVSPTAKFHSKGAASETGTRETCSSRSHCCVRPTVAAAIRTQSRSAIRSHAGCGTTALPAPKFDFASTTAAMASRRVGPQQQGTGSSCYRPFNNRPDRRVCTSRSRQDRAARSRLLVHRLPRRMRKQWSVRCLLPSGDLQDRQLGHRASILLNFPQQPGKVPTP
jgi:hypothetical protein